ncbi:MAG: ABC transporter permease [Candidatus Obscuribacterales bacterium]|nr:ABC transporter permease [Candidatus Obscuribacterales bacterium]
MDDLAFITAVAAGMVRSGTPVLLAAVGECLTERSGILNLGMEGIMLAGALTAVIVSYLTGNIFFAIIAALAIGALIGLLHAFLCLYFHVNQVATGIAVTILLSGITAFCGIDYVGKSIHSISAYKVPWLSELPFFGSVFFNQDILVYLSYAIVPLTYFLINGTRFGLSLKAVGEEPRAAAAAGVSVFRTRCIATALGAMLAALGGAYLSLVYAQGWTENITAGRGWIAVGLVMFASWNPWKAVLGAYLFGLAISLQLRLQAAGADVSPYLLGMAPYLLVILVLAVSKLRQKKIPAAGPTALSIPYLPQV